MTTSNGVRSRSRLYAVPSPSFCVPYLSLLQFKAKNFEGNDVDIKIVCCGVCGSDVHTITGGWGGATLQLCVGHEVIGTAIKVGKNCKTGVKLVIVLAFSNLGMP
jgi:D-arabinose 1-dehydrogenase-like Zn-dependent alcohol dehydrogenase